MTRRRRQAGFTLIELMVALVVGLIAITTIYFVGSASAHHFQEQQRIAQTQMSVRMAMQQLRRDIERAGYLGTPNSRTENRCFTAGEPEVQAVEFLNGVDTDELPNAGENGVKADRLRLAGNYATGDAYLATGLNSTGTGVYLQRTWQAFRRDFDRDTNGLVDGDGAQRFQDVFRPGRMIHIQTMQGKHFFSRITAVDPGQAQISFQSALGIGGTCVNGLADGALVSPLVRLEYRVQDLEQGQYGTALLPVGGRKTGDESYRGEANSQLVRSEVTFGANPQPVVLTDTNGNQGLAQRIVLEYVANASYQFMVNTQLNANQPPTLQRQAGANAANTLQDVNGNPAATPEDVWSVIVSLAAHTAEQDPRFPWVQEAAGVPDGPLPTRYRVNPNYQGAARVRALRTEIFLPNVSR